MSKFGEFLKTTGEISNKDRLVVMGCVTVLAGFGLVLNHKLFESKIKNIDDEFLIESLKMENKLLRNKVYKYEEMEDEYYNK